MKNIEEKDIQEEQGSNTVTEKNPLSSLELTWKSWYWYYLVLFNLSVPGLMALDRIMAKGDTAKTGVLLFLCLFCPIIFTFLMVYMHYSLKNYRDCKVLIKDGRIKNFWRGITASSVSFCFLLIALTSSYKLESSSSTAAASAVVYTLMCLSFILGTVSSVFISIFEFCVSFDIFYSKNKEAIIEQALKYNSAFKIKDKDLEGEEHEN